MTGVVVMPQWTRLDVEDLRGTVIIVGASDTGKSSLARYLYEAFCRQGLRAAYLDGDVGQSSLGLPTTLNLALSAVPGDDRFPPRGPQAAYFVGSTTPRGHLLPTVVGTYRLYQKALALDAEAVVIDTTGLVDSAHGGKALKQWQCELLAPRAVVALQRDRELEPILWPLRRDGRIRTIELPVSPHVQVRSREERIARRRERLAAYFERARTHVVELNRLPIYDVDLLARGALLAFQDAEGFATALGVVDQVDRRGGIFVVQTPLPSLDSVSNLRLGTAHWDLARQRENHSY
jgi:polynucleotide 5'-hydroxyl-kinase GRC3/NOL9